MHLPSLRGFHAVLFGLTRLGFADLSDLTAGIEEQTSSSPLSAMDSEETHSKEGSSVAHSTGLPRFAPLSTASTYSDSEHSDEHATEVIIGLDRYRRPISPTPSSTFHTHSQAHTTQELSNPSSSHEEGTSPPAPLPSGLNTSDQPEGTLTPAISPHTLLSMDEIPQERLVAIKWARKKCKSTNAPNAKAWLVQTKSVRILQESGTNARVWILPEGETELQTAHAEALQRSPQATITRATAFKYGRPMLNVSVTIQTCVGNSRPRKLYRAVHDEMPFGGIAARGFETHSTNGLFVQYHMQNHLIWKCRQPSPFLSTFSDRRRAVSFAATFRPRGYTGIKLLEIDSTGGDWDHNIS